MIFKDKTVLITGGSRGIGKSLCLAFAENGCNIIFTYLRSKTESEKLTKKIKDKGVKVEAIKINLKSTKEIEKLYNFLVSKKMKVNFLINNAASGVMKNSLDTTEKHWDWTLDINAKAPWILSKNIAKIMPKNSRIINITSPGSSKVLKNYFSIGVSKAALESLTRYMAVDLAPKGINVNSISPSLIETDALKYFPNQEDIKSILERKNPKGKKLTPVDIAEVAVLLCQEKSNMIVGQNITIDGGDIMMVGGHYYIGLSERTNLEGAKQIIQILKKYGMSGSTISLNKVLHLKTSLSYLEKNNLVVSGEFINDSYFGHYNPIEIPEKESYAANCIWVNETVIIPQGYPTTKQRITNAGYQVIETDVSEFKKLDGGLSCLSLRY